MSEDATIEDEPDDEQPFSASQPKTKTSLLPWTEIFQIVTKQWIIFLLLSIAIIVYFYINIQRRSKRNHSNLAIRNDHVQHENKRVLQKSQKKKE